MIKLTPLPGFALVKPIIEENAGSFTVKEIDLEKQQKGYVVDVGAAVTNEFGVLIETPIKPGDVVYHRSWGHEVINVEGREYRVVKFLDICLKVEKENDNIQN